MSIQETDSAVTLVHPENPNTSVTILKYGATVYSWKSNGKEKLWLSTSAKLDGTKAVRGGIPLVFPAFGKNTTDKYLKDLPQHGFARTSVWKCNGLVRSHPPTVQFELNESIADEKLIKLWPYKFTIKYNVELGSDHLKTYVDIFNDGQEAFDFNWLFHTYYKINNINDVYVCDLKDDSTHDNITGKDATELNSKVIIGEEVDRRYLNVKTVKPVHIMDAKSGTPLVTLIRSNLPDVVVWNPWIEKAKGMGDFDPKDGYQNMLCVEPGYIHGLATLKPCQKWSSYQYIY
ncbi:hypothetical protein Kpol_1018p167 [Vanderwaltozyma polyspora DSM 70294]|uniref:Glucose-6-phosphate 1-epimerase n=1 Tax=Vanderwaltozyma polyspora (strain ATCC 22028 / DSM 70294 / BCRC 21397 / CBS 2163 / NBRC 10782 / NRRL Y-8283 / UCD 57-17) TaxID=436907 RepID=A7TE07_VANPO|nr:uncharacterized protein Kpol_1018p167 [Vanderwaltozyma polyspora DSM 70294]EDO19627.1 hypothetical protein Kpol_1018p167 [Vanderwaltozyma polyspora DSM 70294]